MMIPDRSCLPLLVVSLAALWVGCRPTVAPSVAAADANDGTLPASESAGVSSSAQVYDDPRPNRDERAAANAQGPPENIVVPDLRTRKNGTDWPGFLGPTGDSTSSEREIITRWPAEGLPIVWHKPIAEGYCAASISMGRLFLFDRLGDRARLRCMKSATGEDLWEFTYPTDYIDMYGFDGGPRCCPVIDGGRVYLFGPEGMLHCVRATDGHLLWKMDTTERFHVVQNFFGVGSTPVIDGDLLIAQVGGSPAGSPGVRSGRTESAGSAVVAFDKYTGEVKYAVGDELASYASPVLATIDGRRWCFVFARGGLLALEPQSGKIDLHYPWRASIIESVNASNPVVVGDTVFISESYSLRHGSSLLRVAPGRHAVVWRDDPARREKSMQAHFVTPVHVDGYLYGSSGRHSPNAELRCIELATGEVQWSEPGLGWTSLLYVDGHFVCLSEDGTLRLVRANPKKYEPVATAMLSETDENGRNTRMLKPPAWAAPVLAQGLLYVRGADRLVCLELIPR